MHCKRRHSDKYLSLQKFCLDKNMFVSTKRKKKRGKKKREKKKKKKRRSDNHTFCLDKRCILSRQTRICRDKNYNYAANDTKELFSPLLHAVTVCSYGSYCRNDYDCCKGLNMKTVRMSYITSFHPTSWTNFSLHYSIQCGQSGDYCYNNNDCCSRQCYNQRCSGGDNNVSTFTLHTWRTRITQIKIKKCFNYTLVTWGCMQIKVADKGQCGEANDFPFCYRFFLCFFLSFSKGLIFNGLTLPKCVLCLYVCFCFMFTKWLVLWTDLTKGKYLWKKVFLFVFYPLLKSIKKNKKNKQIKKI